jgi:ferritin-like metal-binding protein YciE
MKGCFMPIKTLYDLMVDELRNIYHAEKQVTKTLPRMIKTANSTELKTYFEENIRQTDNQIIRLEKIFKELDVPIKPKKCLGMEGILNEGRELINEEIDPNVIDAALVTNEQRIEHYEMTTYDTVRTYAKKLGLNNVAKMLQDTYDEDIWTNKKLVNYIENNVHTEVFHNDVR